MKLFFKAALLALVILPVLGACTRPEDRVRDVAESFLNVYFTGDYTAAADYCTPELRVWVDRMAEKVEAVPEEAQQKMKEALGQTSFKIVSVEVDEKAGSAVVHYDVSVPGVKQPVPKTLSLKLEGRTALVNHVQ